MIHVIIRQIIQSSVRSRLTWACWACFAVRTSVVGAFSQSSLVFLSTITVFVQDPCQSSRPKANAPSPSEGVLGMPHLANHNTQRVNYCSQWAPSQRLRASHGPRCTQVQARSTARATSRWSSQSAVCSDEQQICSTSLPWTAGWSAAGALAAAMAWAPAAFADVEDGVDSMLGDEAVAQAVAGDSGVLVNILFSTVVALLTVVTLGVSRGASCCAADPDPAPACACAHPAACGSLSSTQSLRPPPPPARRRWPTCPPARGSITGKRSRTRRMSPVWAERAARPRTSECPLALTLLARAHTRCRRQHTHSACASLPARAPPHHHLAPVLLEGWAQMQSDRPGAQAAGGAGQAESARQAREEGLWGDVTGCHRA